ncbi:unnamed protein product, partial [Allacma fusca]
QAVINAVKSFVARENELPAIRDFD